ncbi:MAG: hypothetical protein U5R31_04960 [Acidimicrobiia bacterium]|nr:hypothetical protein [Acidimicrobiia bacterium]
MRDNDAHVRRRSGRYPAALQQHASAVAGALPPPARPSRSPTGAAGGTTRPLVPTRLDGLADADLARSATRSLSPTSIPAPRPRRHTAARRPPHRRSSPTSGDPRLVRRHLGLPQAGGRRGAHRRAGRLGCTGPTPVLQ